MKPIILMYHSITDGEPIDPYGVSRKAFCDQISWLLHQDYQFVSLATLVQSGRNGLLTGRRKPVVLTFDDGYHDFLTNALPILLGYRLPATVFLVTDMLGQTAIWSSYGKQLPLLTEAEVRRVKGHGISLGSHTSTHMDMTALANEELQRQLVTSRITLADFGETFFSLSYPWGRHTDREVAAVKSAGYECAVTVDGATKLSGADPYRLGRVTMRRDLELDSFRNMVAGPSRLHHISALVRTLFRRKQEKVFRTK